MGTYLYVDVSQENLFSNADRVELKNRVTELLLEFGECALEKIELYGKKI